ncbi:hypothetical protein IAQ67_28755 (plasmid) [Paenibacillus peoriae]|uniref:Uncharacterized protein n=1 Tax=Paenibacillus peoriae TaxID=59893 RepID=A0A7H0YGZ1_9BACL|nr:hypothetical protein [Paenibacillus peoriae]QNR70349.1 hypothetical protein IAQ67_28755 [Paenibacillus peoriae]
MAQGLRIWGNKKLNPSITITSGYNDELRLTADGVEYVASIAPGEYEVRHEFFDAPDLLAVLNQALKNAKAPITARLGGIHDDTPRTVIVFEHQGADPAAVLEIDIRSTCYSTLIESIYGTEDAVQ